jgi:cytochrome c oxidase subunit 3
MSGPTYQAVMATMVTSTKKDTTRGIGSGGQFPGPNGKKPGGNGWHGGGDRSKRKFSPATYRITMWVLLAAIVMMFVALSSVYIMSSEGQTSVAMPRMFFVSTALIVSSSWTFQRAKRSLQRAKTSAHIRWLLLTLALGIGFLISQLVGWRELARAGVYFKSHPRSTFFYLGTALHGAHLIGGIGLILFLLIRSRKFVFGLEDEKHVAWTSVVGLYWHTMDGIWLWLLLLLLIFK